MNPVNHEQAGRQTAMLVRFQLNGVSSATKRRRIARAEAVGEGIWKRWQLGPRRWRRKHVVWFLTHYLKDRTSSTQYQYWLTIRFLLVALDRGHWIPTLRGPWIRPNHANADESSTGRLR